MQRYTDKVAIVTGGAGGIGLATAQRLGAEGARVVLVDLDRARLDAAAPQVVRAGAPAAWGQVCDVADEGQVAAAVAAAMQQYGRLDAVVNNAGLMTFKPIVELTAADWNRVLGVDLLGAFFFIKHAFGVMQPGSSIVNVSSIHALQTAPLAAPYAAAKAALVSLTRSADIEGRERGIRANAVLPGAVETPMLRDNPDVKSGAEHLDPAEIGQPADIAAAIAWLASDDAKFVRGASVVVDGGRLSGL
jgi:NAD(P)-dependent dehydrogenase (short-subunit alcohol dehydrogenase family)